MRQDQLDRETAALQRLLDKERCARYASISARISDEDPVCGICLQKHRDNPRTRCEFGITLPPVCNASTTQLLAEAAESDWWSELDPVEQANYKIYTDPVYWATVRLRRIDDPDKPWVPEHYQIPPLRCTSNRKLYLFGRQTGKCIIGNSRILLSGGDWVRAELLEGQVVSVLSQDGPRIVIRLAKITRSAVKPCIRLTTTDGRVLEASTDHPISTLLGWVDAADLAPGDELFCLDSNKIVIDRVACVEPIGNHQTYSVSILDTDEYDKQNFAVEGIFTHNTELMAVDFLFNLDTKRNYKIVVVCPYQSQVVEIYGRLLDLINASPDLSSRIKQKRESPIPEIIFDNSSRIRLFTAGVQTGKGSANVRGQPCDLLALDEADYLDKDTIVAIFATLISARDPRMLVSSTPTGARGHFYQWATDPREGFKVFHTESKESPRWNKEIELFYRRNYPAAKYLHEFCADFASAEQGVFRHKDIEAALEHYSVAGGTPQPNETYIIGVDWNNAGIGGQIRIVGYNHDTHKLRDAYKEIVDYGEFTQLQTVERIARLNEVWRPAYVYVDSGYGTTQVEILKKYGMQHPDSGLRHKIRAIDMQSSIEIRDPLTRKMVKKQALNLMVDMCVARMESGQCILSAEEDHNEGLVGQMRVYKRERPTRGGGWKFSGDNDHMITAWGLCILGFSLEFSDLTMRAGTGAVEFNPNQVIEEVLDSKTREAIKKTYAEVRKRLRPVPRSGPRELLSPVDSINFAQHGIPTRTRMFRRSPVSRSRWK